MENVQIFCIGDPKFFNEFWNFWIKFSKNLGSRVNGEGSNGEQPRPKNDANKSWTALFQIYWSMVLINGTIYLECVIEMSELVTNKQKVNN